MVVFEIKGCFMKKFCFDIVCNITQKSQELQGFNPVGTYQQVCMLYMIKYH